MESQEKTGRDWLGMLTILGRLLIFIPMVVLALFSRGQGFATSSPEVYRAGIVVLCGLGILVFVAVKRFYRGLRGQE